MVVGVSSCHGWLLSCPCLFFLITSPFLGSMWALWFSPCHYRGLGCCPRRAGAGKREAHGQRELGARGSEGDLLGRVEPRCSPSPASRSWTQSWYLRLNPCYMVTSREELGPKDDWRAGAVFVQPGEGSKGISLWLSSSQREGYRKAGETLCHGLSGQTLSGAVTGE